MTKQEILDELPRLAPAERGEIWDRIYELEERDLLKSDAIPSDLKQLLDSEWEDYRTRGDHGASWPEVRAQLLQPKPEP